MNSAKLTIFFTGILLFSWTISAIAELRFSATLFHPMKNITTLDHQTGFVLCKCNGVTKMVEFPRNMSQDVFRNIIDPGLCRSGVPLRICTLLNKCESCSAASVNCRPKFGGENECFKTKMEFSALKRKSSYGISSVAALGRKRRHAGSCSYPQDMKYSDLQIIFFPSSILVKQKCIFGYTLEEGISREMRCVYEEDIWRPKLFEECRPFVDCVPDLISPGSVNCTTATKLGAPKCFISCEAYEDRLAEKGTSECKINGFWEPRLPYCAQHGSAPLVTAPKIKLHSAKKEAEAENRKSKNSMKTKKLKLKN